MKVIILAGGFGSRLSEYTNLLPKPMVPIGDKPMLWHIMNTFASQGHKSFYLALGYKAEIVKNYFLNYRTLSSSLRVNLGTGDTSLISSESIDWDVTMVDTGLNTMTGGRLKRMKAFVGDEACMVTYGDGLSNVCLKALLSFHKNHGNLATVTAVRPPARFGGLNLTADKVSKFTEKPQLGDGWINGGFFIFEPAFFDLIAGDETSLEREPLELAAARGQLMAYKHEGFWQCMDSKRDHDLLQDLWQNNPPWKV
jgi:glucose-1-phosphate cytidylyltransferase